MDTTKAIYYQGNLDDPEVTGFQVPRHPVAAYIPAQTDNGSDWLRQIMGRAFDGAVRAVVDDHESDSLLMGTWCTNNNAMKRQIEGYLLFCRYGVRQRWLSLQRECWTLILSAR